MDKKKWEDAFENAPGSIFSDEEKEEESAEQPKELTPEQEAILNDLDRKFGQKEKSQ